MTTQENDRFGYWLAGFIDGEGCFYIQSNHKTGCAPRFSLRVRGYK